MTAILHLEIQIPIINISNNGIFNPSAFVESNNGCIQEIQIDNVINVSNGPTGSFIMSNISGCPPLPVQFDIST